MLAGPGIPGHYCGVSRHCPVLSLLFASRRSPSTVSMIDLSRKKTQVEQIKANEYY